MRKLALLILSFLFVFSINSIAFAEPTKSLSDTLKFRNKKIVDQIGKVNSKKDLEDVLTKVCEETDLSRYSIEGFKDKSLTQKVKITDELTIEFLDNGGFAIDEITSRIIDPAVIEEPTNQLTSQSIITPLVATYKYASHTRTVKSWTNITLYTIFVENNFGYDGSKAWASGGFNAYYRKGTVCLWQVSNWEKGTTLINGGEKCQAYGRGNFYLGFTVAGTTCSLQDNYENLWITCDKFGNIVKS